MRYALYGNSPSLAYLAALLSEAGFGVDWHKSRLREPIRPLKLHGPLLKQLKLLLVRHDASSALIDAAPEVQAWSLPEGRSYDFSAGFWDADEDRWVESSLLAQAFAKLSAQLGAQIKDVDRLPPPEFAENTRVILDVDAAEISHWPSSFFWTQDDHLRVESTEIWLRSGRMAQTYPAQFVSLEGTLAFLEPHPREGFSLSLYSGSRYEIEKSLKDLQSSRGLGPSLWRALLTMNPGAPTQHFTQRVGLSSLYLPGAYLSGLALGRLPPMANLQDGEAFAQKQRLFRALCVAPKARSSDYYRATEEWYQKEVSRFRATYKRLRFWEKLLFSGSSRKYVLSMTTLMPASLRRFLKSPL